MAKQNNLAIGIDIGGTRMKGAVVDVSTGELVGERVELATPAGCRAAEMREVAAEIVTTLTAAHGTLPVGTTFPAIVRDGYTLTATNVSDDWLNLNAAQFFSDRIGQPVTVLNDADAAGIAEQRFGAARGRTGLTLVLTLGTGIGSAFIHDGVLVPNVELGRLRWTADLTTEKYASNAARERENLSFEVWAARLQEVFAFYETIFSPSTLIIGGGISNCSEKFLPLISTTAELIPATFRNSAGIIGAAMSAAGGRF